MSTPNQFSDDGKSITSPILRRGPKRGRSHSVTFSLGSDITDSSLKRPDSRSSESLHLSSTRPVSRSRSMTEIKEELIIREPPQQSRQRRTRSRSYSNVADFASLSNKKAIISSSNTHIQQKSQSPDVLKPLTETASITDLVKSLDSRILEMTSGNFSVMPQPIPKPVLPSINATSSNASVQEKQSKSGRRINSRERSMFPAASTVGNISGQRRHSEQVSLKNLKKSSSSDEIHMARNAMSAGTNKRTNSSLQSHFNTQQYQNDIRQHLLDYKAQSLKLENQDLDKPKVKYDKTGTKRSIEVQTDWSWMEDWKLHNLMKESAALLSDDDETSNYSPENRNMYQKSLAEQTVSAITIVDGSHEENSTIPEEAFSRHNTPSSTVSSPKADSPSEISDAFGLPTIELSSDSSDDEGGEQEDTHQETLLDIGPPTILKYNRESEETILRVDLQTPMTSQSAASYHSSVTDSHSEGLCDYCGLPIIKEFPTKEEMETIPAEKLFCCPDYHQFVLYLHEINDSKLPIKPNEDDGDMNEDRGNSDVSDAEEDPLINVSPHAPFKNVQARREARERAQEKMRERERERQLATGINNMNYYAFARQIKTINYSLSSNRCIEEGWTVIPTPLPEQDLILGDEDDNLSYLTEIPSNVAFLQQQAKGSRAPIQKLYPNGCPFLYVLPDGTGSVYYPSGNIAIGINSHGNGLSYVVLEDAPLSESQKILAIFSPSGHGCTYYSNNIIRMVLYPTGGEVADSNGTRKKRWSWEIDTYTDAHIHAPPFQPICFAINKEVAVRCIWQDKVYLSFSSYTRSCRFNAGVKLKLINAGQLPELSRAQKTEIENENYLNDTKRRIRRLLDKTQNALKYPKSPRLEQLPPPRYLISDKDKLRSSHRLQLPKQPRDSTVSERDGTPISVKN